MHADSTVRAATGVDNMTEHLTVAEVSGQPFAPLAHASPLPQVPTTDVKTETSEILYTDTPRLLSSPTYSAMSASPALSSRHSPAVASAAAQPAAELTGRCLLSNPPLNLYGKQILVGLSQLLTPQQMVDTLQLHLQPSFHPGQVAACLVQEPSVHCCEPHHAHCLSECRSLSYSQGCANLSSSCIR